MSQGEGDAPDVSGAGPPVNPATPDGHSTGQPPAGVLRRATLILEVIAAGTATGSAALNLTQVAAATDLPLASTHRTLDQLVTLGWLRRDGKQYRLGARLATLGSTAIVDVASAFSLSGNQNPPRHQTDETTPWPRWN